MFQEVCHKNEYVFWGGVMTPDQPKIMYHVNLLSSEERKVQASKFRIFKLKNGYSELLKTRKELLRSTTSLPMSDEFMDRHFDFHHEQPLKFGGKYKMTCNLILIHRLFHEAWHHYIQDPIFRRMEAIKQESPNAHFIVVHPKMPECVDAANMLHVFTSKEQMEYLKTIVRKAVQEWAEKMLNPQSVERPVCVINSEKEIQKAGTDSEQKSIVQKEKAACLTSRKATVLRAKKKKQADPLAQATEVLVSVMEKKDSAVQKKPKLVPLPLVKKPVVQKGQQKGMSVAASKLLHKPLIEPEWIEQQQIAAERNAILMKKRTLWPDKNFKTRKEALREVKQVREKRRMAPKCIRVYHRNKGIQIIHLKSFRARAHS